MALRICIFILFINTITAHIAFAVEPPVFLLKWGSRGSGNGELNYPRGITVDSNGDVYVVDSFNHRIQKFSNDGNYITKWGSRGSGDYQFNYPHFIAVDKDGYLYIADHNNNRVQKFTINGDFVMSLSSPLGYALPSGIAVDSDCNVYVTEYNSHRIQKLTSNGVFITSWGGGGSGDGQFYRPYGVAVDKNGYVYVAEWGNCRVQKFTNDGTFICKWGSKGSGDGQFETATGIAVDQSGYVYVADHVNHRIQMFTSDGEYLTKWGSYGSGNGQFAYPMQVSVETNGNIFVADYAYHRIQKFVGAGDTYPECAVNNDIASYQMGIGGNQNALEALGQPNGTPVSLGDEGVITLIFPCYVVDGNGNDLMVFEMGTSSGDIDENYEVHVSDDGEYYYSIGVSAGGCSFFDLSSIALNHVRYVRITDLQPSEGAADPFKGADIDAVVALNCQNLIYETPLGEVTGTVKDAVSKQLLDGIIVRVVNPPHMRSSALTVSGSYQIPHITTGVCVIEAIDPNGGYIAQTQSNVTVTENGLTPVSFYLPPEEPRIEVTALYFEDDDSKFTMGDHVTLHCELTNRGGPAEDVTLVFYGLSDNDGYPNLRFSPNGSSNWSYTHQESKSGLWVPGQTHICQDIHAYIGVVDPDETARRGLDIPRYVKVDISWGGKSTSETINLNSIFFDPVPDFPAGYGDLRGADCLRKAGTSPVVRRYAQYSAANADEENPERDPDTRINAAHNVWDILVAREQFKVNEWALWRKSDEEMVGQRYGKIGMCRHYMDLSTGLLRSLGIHTRDILVEYKSWVGHGFNEFYAENDQGDFGWIQYDAAQNKFNNRSFYSNNLLFAWGDKNPLSDAGILTLVSCRWECVAQVCPLCIQGSPLGIPYPCFENRLDFYNSAGTSMRTQNYFPSEILDSLAIELTAPKKSYLSTPFQVTAIVQNNSYHSSPPCYAYLMKNTDVFNTMGVYSVIPDSIYIPALNTGESDTINFTLTPITYRKYSAISMFLCDDLGNFLTGQSISQAIFENETFSSLVVESAVVSGSTIPFETMHVASSVLNDSLDVEDEASVVAYLRSSRDTLFTDSFLMIYDGADSLYRGTYAVPLTAPIGRYDLTVIATHPVLLPDTLEESFSVSSLLEMNISAPDSCAPLDTVIVRATVTDRGDTVETAGVTLHVAYDSHEEIVIPLVSDSSLCHSGSFIPHTCVEQWGGEAFESGLWNLRVSISYGGATVTDSVDLEVIAPDLAIDGSQVSFYPSTPTSLERLTVGVTVKNLGNAPSDSCYVDLYRNQGESLEFLTGGITLPPLAAGDSARVTLYTGTVYWQGTQDLVLIVDDRAQIDDSDRENNLVSRSLTVIEPVTSVHEDYENSPPYRYTLNQNYPNPFNPVTTIEFEIQKRERVTLDIYDIRGVRVKRLVDRSLAAGRYRVEWKGKNQLGANVSSGIYFCRIKTGDWESNLKMVLLR